MLFNSIDFIVFFPIVIALYFLLPHRFRWVWLLAASYYFYMTWKPEYILLIVGATLATYVLGIRMAADRRPSFRRTYLLLGIGLNIGALLIFKYFNFFNSSFRVLFTEVGVNYPIPTFNLLLPVGISFFTFQTTSYLVDVYRGIKVPERHLGIFALFVSFFPQLVAGPIERAGNLLPQFLRESSFDYERVVTGLQRMTWGFFKKVVIADRLALMVDTVYGDPTQFAGNYLILATYAFSIQIYCDFSGYSDIAIGAARVLGIRLSENFQQPYYAQSISEFWNRWHITLSNWLRDYIYLPLSRSFLRRNLSRWNWSNIVIPSMITMLVSGLWHGANWTFVIWGALHGVFMVLAIVWNLATRQVRWPIVLPNSIQSIARSLLTFNLVTFAWIFFRANSVPDALYIVTHLFDGISLGLTGYFGVMMPGGTYEVGIAVLAIMLMELVHWLQLDKRDIRLAMLRQPFALRWLIYYALVLAIIVFGKFGLAEFIYFQF